MNNKKFHVILAVFVIVGTIFAYFYKSNEYDSKAFEQTVDQKNKHKYGVAAAHPEAVKVGMRILEQGGNAVDAAIAVGYALGVVEPYGSGLGGGGTMLIDFYSKEKDPVVIDYRETAPYTGIIPDNGVGVPGFVKGMELAHQRYGKLPMEQLIQPSIELAEQGFEVTPILNSRLQAAKYRLPVNDLKHMFPDGEPIQAHRLLVQKDLANTLKAIQKDGSKAFYEGLIAKDIENKSQGVKVSDLHKYQPLVKEPLVVKYGNYEMITPSPPTGGIMLAESLKMADKLKVGKTRDLSADQIHLLGEIDKRVNHARRQNVGDPQFAKVPVKEMLADQYIQQLTKDINLKQISSQYQTVADSLADKEEHDNTTHFVVVDKDGNMVTVTNTLSNFFGSGIYVDGFFLNNQLKNFSIIKSSPNRPQLGKRPVSYTAPTIFAKNGRPVLGIGSAGGSRITPVLTQVVLRILEYDLPVQSAINRPRFIVEDNIVYVEKALPANVQKELEQKGYQVIVKPTGMYYGGVQGIRVNRSKNKMEGGFDGRRDGAFRFGAD